VFYEGQRVIGIWDAYPVSPGHALLLPKRHISTWFEADPAEQAELFTAIEHARAAIERQHQPAGYNVGVNIGVAAGQTVFHLHLHVIPRYPNDVPDPRGGVRYVIPDKANYLRESPLQPYTGVPPHLRALVDGYDDPFLPHLVAHLDRATHVDIAVAFRGDRAGGLAPTARPRPRGSPGPCRQP
jgi:diadenosine tetraphosphate (Ap4A) HIT family hydrolase